MKLLLLILLASAAGSLAPPVVLAALWGSFPAGLTELASDVTGLP
jgi:hypothetical protein